MTNKTHRHYKVRYEIDPNWHGMVANSLGEQMFPGVRVMDGKWGCADDLFIVSVIRDEETGEISSLMPIDTTRVGLDGKLDRELLDTIIAMLTHWRDHHPEMIGD